MSGKPLSKVAELPVKRINIEKLDFDLDNARFLPNVKMTSEKAYKMLRKIGNITMKACFKRSCHQKITAAISRFETNRTQNLFYKEIVDHLRANDVRILQETINST